jgi:hypothetical protein
MAIPILVLGASGSGKSTSLRNFNPGEVGIFNVSGKPLPFKTQLKTFNCDDYGLITQKIGECAGRIKSIVIDDCTYLMVNEYMRMAKVNGYQKFTDMALHFWELLKFCGSLPPDVLIYFMGHTELDANGGEKMKTVGKMLDNTVTLEGLFSIVLKTHVTDGKYTFVTQTNGADTVKSPWGMFPNEIPNDLKAVDTAIRNFYFNTNEEGENNG